MEDFSRILKNIVGSHGWAFYDVTNGGRSPLSFEKGHEYLLVPLPREGQTLEEAFNDSELLQ